MFSHVIALYRALNRPEISPEYTCCYVGPLSAATRALAEACVDMNPAFGSVEIQDEDDADGGLRNDSAAGMSSADVLSGYVRVDIQLSTNEHGRVYRTLSDFLQQAPSIAFGKLPLNHYIVELDYYSGDPVKPDAIIRIERLAKFIELLSKLADDRVEFGRKNRLLFILPTDASKVRRTALAEIAVEPQALEYELPHLQLLEQLVAEDSANKLHIEERTLIMRSVIADSLAAETAESNDLTYLCEQWRTIQQKYRANFQAYIQNFAFDDVRKKIVDSELEYASKLTAAFGDVAGKLLALPASLVALGVLDHLASDSAFLLGCAGIVLVTVVILFVLNNLRYQIDRLQSGFEFVFSPLFDKSKTYPAKFQAVLQARKNALQRQARLTRITFWTFLVLAIAPTVGAIWKIWLRYPQIEAWLQSVFR